jgi:hypothetical protein
VFDSGCTNHMTGGKGALDEFIEAINSMSGFRFPVANLYVGGGFVTMIRWGNNLRHTRDVHVQAPAIVRR